MKDTLRKTIYYSIMITLTAQFSMNLFIADFKISIAVVCFSALLFLTEGFPSLPVACCSAAGVYISRILVFWFKNGCLGRSFLAYMAEMSFYICYGLLLCLFIHLRPDYRRHRTQAFFVVILTDYLANLSELLLRMGADSLNIRAQAGIFLIAVFRSLILWCILTIFEHYRIFLLKKEHEERYRRLLLLTSKLNGEIAWMRKNTSLIEDTMSTSYQLYHELKCSGHRDRGSSYAGNGRNHSCQPDASSPSRHCFHHALAGLFKRYDRFCI